MSMSLRSLHDKLPSSCIAEMTTFMRECKLRRNMMIRELSLHMAQCISRPFASTSASSRRTHTTSTSLVLLWLPTPSRHVRCVTAVKQHHCSRVHDLRRRERRVRRDLLEPQQRLIDPWIPITSHVLFVPLSAHNARSSLGRSQLALRARLSPFASCPL